MIRFVVIAAMMISIKYIYNGYLINKNKEVLWYYDSNSNYHLSLDEKDSINSSKSVIIAVIDSGVDIYNESISGYVWSNKREVEDGKDDDNNGYPDDINGWNFIDNNSEVFDKNNPHGTSIASIICSNSERYCKGNKANIQIMSLRVLDEDGECKNVDAIINAIKYAEQNGASVCNMSFDTSYYSKELEKTINDSKMLFVVSAGNKATIGSNIDNCKNYPACFNCDNIITVGSATRTEKTEIKSNFGSKNVDILAPGKNIYCLSYNGKNEKKTGTSFATPFVSSVAAIKFSFHKNISANKVKSLILDEAIKKKELEEFVNKGALLK